MIPALREAARQFFDALGPSNPLIGREREFWLVLFALVADDTTKPADLTDDTVLAIYATDLAIDFLESRVPALPASVTHPGPGFPPTADGADGGSRVHVRGRPLAAAGNGARTVAPGRRPVSDSESGPVTWRGAA